VHLNVVTTLRCNLRCAHCIYACPAEGDVDTDVFLALLDDLVPRGLGSLTFTGGEPGLHPHFPRLVEGAASRGLRFGVATNGWDLDHYDGVATHLGTLFTGFHVSLDGMEATHDQQRGAGSFARVAAALEHWRAEGIPAQVNVVLHDGNVGEVDDVVAFCAGAGAAEVKLAGLMPVPRAPGMVLSPPVRLGVGDLIPELERRHGIPVRAASSLLTPPEVRFCPVMTSRTLTLDERSRHTWCCDAPGSVLGARGDPVESVLTRRAEVTNEMTLDRILKVRRDALSLADRTCAYCHGFFHAAPFDA